MALKPEDVQQWNNVIRAVAPTVAMGIDAVSGLVRGIIKLVRRTEGRPEEQPGDDVLVAEVAASLTKAEKPWEQIRDTADRELKD